MNNDIQTPNIFPTLRQVYACALHHAHSTSAAIAHTVDRRLGVNRDNVSCFSANLSRPAKTQLAPCPCCIESLLPVLE